MSTEPAPPDHAARAALAHATILRAAVKAQHLYEQLCRDAGCAESADPWDALTLDAQLAWLRYARLALARQDGPATAATAATASAESALPAPPADGLPKSVRLTVPRCWWACLGARLGGAAAFVLLSFLGLEIVLCAWLAEQRLLARREMPS